MRKIYHRREKCIGCGYCIGMAAEFWVMNEDDGKCSLVGAELKNQEFVLEIFDDEVAMNRKAAEICPTNCIRIQ